MNCKNVIVSLFALAALASSPAFADDQCRYDAYNRYQQDLARCDGGGDTSNLTCSCNYVDRGTYSQTCAEKVSTDTGAVISCCVPHNRARLNEGYSHLSGST